MRQGVSGGRGVGTRVLFCRNILAFIYMLYFKDLNVGKRYILIFFDLETVPGRDTRL